jgi:hypothetical protein
MWSPFMGVEGGEGTLSLLLEFQARTRFATESRSGQLYCFFLPALFSTRSSKCEVQFDVKQTTDFPDSGSGFAIFIRWCFLNMNVLILKFLPSQISGSQIKVFSVIFDGKCVIVKYFNCVTVRCRWRMIQATFWFFAVYYSFGTRWWFRI